MESIPQRNPLHDGATVTAEDPHMTDTKGTSTIPQRVKTVSIVVTVLLSVAAGATRAGAQTHAYVANTKANLVTVIDTASDTEVAAIGVGSAPTQVVISQDGLHAYVINTGSNSVSVVDTATNTVSATITLAEQPSSVAVKPSGGVLYVLSATGVLDVIETGEYSVLTSIPIGGSDGKLAITPDGGQLYVASGNVTVIDTATNKPLASFAPETVAVPDVFNFAVDVVISPDGARAYVPFTTYDYSYSLFGFTASGGLAVIDTASVSDTGTRNVSTIPLFSLPGSIALTQDGSRAFVGIEYEWRNTLYGAGFFPGRTVIAIDTATSAMAGWIDLGADGALWTQQHTATGLAVTPDRSAVFASIASIDRVDTISVAANTVTGTIPVAAGPSGVAVVPDPAANAKPFAIDAVDDSPATAFPALGVGAAVANVLANDTLGGARAALANVTLSTVSSTSAGVTLDAAGAVWIAGNTEVGTQTLTYRICERSHASNCDTAVVTLTVRAPYAIVAVSEHATGFAGTATIANVVANDTLNGAPAGPDTVTLTLLSSSDAAIALNGDGSVVTAGDAAIGDHSVTYRICETASPTNCADATATITIVPHVVRAMNDSATSPRTGGIAVANVMANDTFDGAPATFARVSLSFVSSTDPGVTLNAATGAVAVTRGAGVGAQMLMYRLCEIASPANCSDAAVAVTVDPYVVMAVADQATASSKRPSIAIASVLTNDTIGGVQATLSNVTLSMVSMTPSNSKIRLNGDGSVEVLGKTTSGLYKIVYQICESGAPTNCSRTTVSLDLSGK